MTIPDVGSDGQGRAARRPDWSSWPAQVLMASGAWLVTRFILFETTLHGSGSESFRAGSQDVESYRRWGLLIRQGSFPVGDVGFQYPPGAGLLFLLFGSDKDTYLRHFTLGALAADAAILVMLMVVATRTREGSWRGPWTWVVGGFLVGPIMLLRFDIFPTLLAVGGVLLSAYPVLLGVAAGAGAFIKVWPGLTLLAVPRRHLLRAAIASLVTLAVSWSVAAVLFRGSLGFLPQMSERGLQIESVAAWPFLAWRVVDPGAWTPAFRYGSVEVDAPQASVVATLSVVVGAALLGWLLVARIRGRLESVPGADVVLAAVLVFLVFNKVDSPQFGVWLVGMAAAALACRRSRMLPAAALVVLAVTVTDRVISNGVGGHGALIDGDAVLVLAQGIRVLLLVLAAGYATYVVLLGRQADEPLADVSQGQTAGA